MDVSFEALKCMGISMKTIEYARVSTRDQDLTSQLDALSAAGAGAIYREKVSGARADPSYRS